MIRPLGARYHDGTCDFTVWAPRATAVAVGLLTEPPRAVPLQPDQRGYWTGRATEITPGTRYHILLDDDLHRPDPASRYQPEGVHGPSQIVDSAFGWTDHRWRGLPLGEMVIYELHVGTFTPEGTFAGVVGKLDYLKRLGVNALEIMPVAAFPGARNWGYDGVCPFAVHTAYGGPEGLKTLVDACHAAGIAVLLDVVYNHLGPEGNYLRDFGPYFTDKYHTPWGEALNFDDAHSDEVRNYFIQNALLWLDEYHLDGLRLDAVHAIKDLGPRHFLAELSAHVRALERRTDRQYVLLAECDLNDHRYIDPPARGGYGLDGQWADEFHHALHALVTGERQEYYAEFGAFEQVRKAFVDTYVFDGIYSAHRHRTFGTDTSQNPYGQFAVFAQNHDQTGNRPLGDRLSTLVDFETQKLVAVALLLSPHVPLLFMGEEYGERNPFMYFVSHGDPALVEAVREGRRREFAGFFADGAAPDPQDTETFERSKLSWDYTDRLPHQQLWELHRFLINLRKTHPALQSTAREDLTATAHADTQTLVIERRAPVAVRVVLHFGQEEATLTWAGEGFYEKILDTTAERWGGPGPLASEGTATDLVQADDRLALRGRCALVYATKEGD